MQQSEQVFPLGILPTPLHRLERLQKALGTGPIYAKRDDLIGFAAGGNKTRPLEYLLGEAVAQSCDTVVTGGGPDSNFCHGAAAASAAAGLSCDLMMFVSDEAPAARSSNMLLSAAFGARMHYLIGSGETVDDAIPERAEQLRRAGHRPYAIPRGGSSAIGVLGFLDAAVELDSQLRGSEIRPEAVVCAVGSGGSYAGLVTGSIALEAPWRVVGASVSRPLREICDRVLDLAAQCAQRRGMKPPSMADLDIVDAVGGGHGQLTPAQTELAQLALSEEGLFLDDTYTAKSFELAVTMAANANGPIIFWHTGGVSSALSALVKGTVDG
jgi:D-cysteine desulfhydrase